MVRSPGSREESTAPAAISPSRPGRDKTACDAKGMPQIFQLATVSGAALVPSDISVRRAPSGPSELAGRSIESSKLLRHTSPPTVTRRSQLLAADSTRPPPRLRNFRSVAWLHPPTMAGCEDLWEAQFPNEIGDWQGHSCSYKRQWGQCEQFGEFCAKTCEMCNASPSAPGSVSIRLLLMAAAIFIAFALLAIASAWLLGAFADMKRNRQRRRTSSGSRSPRTSTRRRAQRYRRQEAEDVEDYVVELEAPVEMDDDGEPRVPPLRKDDGR